MIYHIQTEDLWQRALLDGEYLPENFESNRFIHCADLPEDTDDIPEADP